MPLLLRSLLVDAGLEPSSTKVLRHNPVSRGGDLLAVWRRAPGEFERYQSIQTQASRSYFARPFWASFIASPTGSACFVGVYAVRRVGPVPTGFDEQLGSAPPDPSKHDLYACDLTPFMAEFIGRLFIGWSGMNWRQNGEGVHIVEELSRTARPPDFPGFVSFLKPLSEISYLPESWISHLRQGRGVYLLTCPRTKEQYVGKADGEDGFLGRWLTYVSSGHGGNVRLKSREPSDYQISILEVAGSAATAYEIGLMEERWKRKLQSREMGLNAN